MNKNMIKFKTNKPKDLSYKNPQITIMGGAIAGLNVLLMTFVCLYWTNIEFHTFITGKPL